MRIRRQVRRSRRWPGGSTAGQSIAELALILPVLLLILLVGLDFGRIFLGWVNLQTMVRNAANYAANNPNAWTPPIDTTDLAIQAKYNALVAQDARAINCDLPPTVPQPQMSGTTLGDDVAVEIPCHFSLVTPIIGAIVGNQVTLTATAHFPVKTGGVSDVYGGGTPPVDPPAASFIASPTGGYAPLAVSFFDTSTNDPTSWSWTFGDGNSSFDENPTHPYATGTWTVDLHVCNAGGCSDSSADIEVTDPPTTGPIPDFDGQPRTGPYPLTVAFTDLSTGTATSWQWDFGDGGTSSQENPTHTFGTFGSFTVSLTVSDGTTPNTVTKTGFIVTGHSPCVVPNFAGALRNQAQGIWDNAGFSTTVMYSQMGQYTIQNQSLPAFLTDPPGGCDATIQVGPQ